MSTEFHCKLRLEKFMPKLSFFTKKDNNSCGTRISKSASSLTSGSVGKKIETVRPSSSYN